MKTVLVTGAAGNLGQAVVKRFLQENYNVISVVSPKETKGITVNGKHVETAMVDLSLEEAARQFVEFAAVKHTAIDVAVLTVGGFAMGKIADTKTTDIARQYQLNFETAYNIARPVFLQMMQQGSGHIFLIGSKPGLEGKEAKGKTAYGLSKSLLFHLAEIMNEEATGTDVVVSVVVPGTIDTVQNRESMPDADFSAWVKPGSIADTIFFYASGNAAAIREPVIKLYNRS